MMNNDHNPEEEPKQHTHYLHSIVSVATGEVWYPNRLHAVQ